MLMRLARHTGPVTALEANSSAAVRAPEYLSEAYCQVTNTFYP
jgi:hypothetical protein